MKTASTKSTPKTAVVTGAGSGLGRAFCQELARDGYRIMLSDIDESSARETDSLLREEFGAGRELETYVFVCDVADAEQVRALSDQTRATFGHCDLLINNAGIAVAGALGDVSLGHWREIVDINLMGVVYGCHHFVPAMKERGSGAIINVASAAGLIHLPDMSAYNATKAAVVALTETLFAELKHTGVSATVLCPTFFATNIWRSARGAKEHESFVRHMMDKSKLSARDVARFAIEASRKGQLHAVPMGDGRLAWRAKRLSPRVFQGLLNREYQSQWFRRTFGPKEP